MKKANPFTVNHYQKPKYYCNRKIETNLILNGLGDGESYILSGPIGIGKSFLLRHIEYKLAKKQEYIIFNIVLDKVVAGEQILNSIFDRLKKYEIEKKSEEVNAALLNESALKDKLKEKLQNGALQSKRTVIIIENYIPSKESNATIDSFVDKLNNGSIILETRTNNFNFQNIRQIELGPIEQKNYQSYIIKLFNSRNVKITRKAISTIFDLTKAKPFHTQLLCSKLWEKSNKKIKPIDVYETISEIVNESLISYEIVRSLLSDYQFKLLNALANQNGAKQITSQKFISTYHLNAPSSVKTAIKSLIDKQIVVKEAEGYSVNDPFLAYWLTT